MLECINGQFFIFTQQPQLFRLIKKKKSLYEYYKIINLKIFLNPILQKINEMNNQ